MTSMYVSGSPIYTMFDSSKGSKENRTECAKEHLKNNLKFATISTVTGLGSAGIYYSGKFGKWAPKVGEFLQKIPGLKNLITNPTKAGKLAMIAVPAAILYHTFCKAVYNQGKIDERYTQRANNEDQRNNVLLDV